MDIGKKCEAYCLNDLVAHGEIVEVDPNALVHNVPVGEGNYKIMIGMGVDRGTPLFKWNSQVTVFEDVVGGYTIWPKI
ncbi:hypothetical protein FRX31_006703 [Thalictrum thalictroides]|uniref:Uncharacterized protein n=1 Tax=Thalictrum thalictroides TaxID=46969 RepID=A0A7J6X557_THATH|nr:hypothetical protein FRX31_006703 [Thalictrum thalictroides]